MHGAHLIQRLLRTLRAMQAIPGQWERERALLHHKGFVRDHNHKTANEK